MSYHMSSPDILLVTLPPWGVNNPPVGLAYLDSYLKSKGVNSCVLDFNILFHNSIDKDYRMLWHVENKNYWSNQETFPLLRELFKKQIDFCVDKVLSSNTDLIGFSVVDPKERLTIEVIRRIKLRNRFKKIILGGPACATESQRKIFLDNIPEHIEAFVVGEGEQTLYELIERLKKGQSISGLPGAVTKQNGSWRYLLPESIEPLDKIPFPDYQGFPLKEYLSRSLILEWSRGCIGRCSFCKNFSLVEGYRSRSPEHILKELDYHITKNRIDEFTICDSLMNGNLRLLHKLCDLIINAKLKFKWTGQIAPRKDLGYELLLKMRQAGCFKLQVGVESGSDLILKRMRKLYNAQDAERLLQDAHRAGIITEIFIMVGFPGEDETEFNKTVEFIKRNAPYIDTIKSINTLHLIAGTEIYDNHQRYGIIDLPSKNWHYLWETTDGNNYSIRKQRGQRLLSMALGLGINVLETNLKEGKESVLVDLDKNLPAYEKLERLKTQINDLQKLAIEKGIWEKVPGEEAISKSKVIEKETYTIDIQKHFPAQELLQKKIFKRDQLLRYKQEQQELVSRSLSWKVFSQLIKIERWAYVVVKRLWRAPILFILFIYTLLVSLYLSLLNALRGTSIFGEE